MKKTRGKRIKEKRDEKEDRYLLDRGWKRIFVFGPIGMREYLGWWHPEHTALNQQYVSFSAAMRTQRRSGGDFEII